MGLMMCDGKFVSRDEVALVPTPGGTESWKPVPHMEVIEAVTDVVKQRIANFVSGTLLKVLNAIGNRRIPGHFKLICNICLFHVAAGAISKPIFSLSPNQASCGSSQS